MEYGSSYSKNISTILDILWALQPSTILDIGCGHGKYGFLIREYLSPKYIDAIEVFQEYICGIQEGIYNTVLTGDALLLFREGLVGNYDVILLIDVLEHFEEKESKEVLAHAYRHAKTVIVSVPKNNSNQGTLGGNEYQKHRYQWTPVDFTYLTKRCSRIPSKESYIFVMGDNWYKFTKTYKLISWLLKGRLNDVH